MSGTTAFLGMSHLGINYAAAWSSLGQATLALDPDASLVTRLQSGDLPIQEPGLEELIQHSGDNLTFTHDFTRLANCDLAVVARDVPTDDDNRSDLSPVQDLVDLARRHLRPGATLVVMSQIPPGFMRTLSRQASDLHVYYWVETLVFGDAVRRATRPERIIIGCSDPRAPLSPALAQGLDKFGAPVLPMRYESAELTKTAINLYLAGSVTYANSLSDLCESVGADWSEMVPALKLDARIGPAAYLRPGLGIAGGNLERDLVTLHNLCSEADVDSTYVDALIDYNARRLNWIERQLQRHVFADSRSPEVAVWGLTYKKNTRSTKNSPALRVIASLERRAQVRAWDPAIPPGELDVSAEVVDDPYAATNSADALLVMADWDQFAAADLERLKQGMRRPLIIDCAGVLDRRRSEMDGIQYVAMGQ
jgi:UDPglucose 6-dehydrogenase